MSLRTRSLTGWFGDYSTRLLTSQSRYHGDNYVRCTCPSVAVWYTIVVSLQSYRKPQLIVNQVDMLLPFWIINLEGQQVLTIKYLWSVWNICGWTRGKTLRKETNVKTCARRVESYHSTHRGSLK